MDTSYRLTTTTLGMPNQKVSLENRLMANSHHLRKTKHLDTSVPGPPATRCSAASHYQPSWWRWAGHKRERAPRGSTKNFTACPLQPQDALAWSFWPQTSAPRCKLFTCFALPLKSVSRVKLQSVFGKGINSPCYLLCVNTKGNHWDVLYGVLNPAVIIFRMRDASTLLFSH
jgi:hypothetical protein